MRVSILFVAVQCTLGGGTTSCFEHFPRSEAGAYSGRLSFFADRKRLIGNHISQS
jgi:hypothetical protein